MTDIEETRAKLQGFIEEARELGLINKEPVYVSEEDFLGPLIKNTEARYIDYGKMLAELYKEKAEWEKTPEGAEFFEWYKSMLRDYKNMEEKTLKELRLEQEHARQGLNPPFCYPDFKRKQN